MGCCQAGDSGGKDRGGRRSASQGAVEGYLDSTSMKASSLAEMIAAGYHERTLSATTVDFEFMNDTRIRALAVQDALQYGHFLDPKARELEDYVLSLQFDSNWSSIWALDGVIIDSLPRSQFSALHPVFRVKVHFDANVRLNFLLAMLENPDIRAKWDYSLQHINVLYVADENYYIKNSVLWTTSPLVTREFVEKCQVRDVDEELRLVYYSVEHQDGIVRATTLFGMLQLHTSLSGVDLTLTYQYSELIGKDLDIEIHTLYDWVDRLQREIELSSL